MSIKEKPQLFGVKNLVQWSVGLIIGSSALHMVLYRTCPDCSGRSSFPSSQPSRQGPTGKGHRCPFQALVADAQGARGFWVLTSCVHHFISDSLPNNFNMAR